MNEINKDFEETFVIIKIDKFGRTELANTLEGLTEYRYVRNDRHFKKILAVPIILVAIYQDKEERYYEVNLNGVILCLPKMKLIDHITNRTNLAYISGKKLRDSISLILRALEEKNNIKPKKMF